MADPIGFSQPGVTPPTFGLPNTQPASVAPPPMYQNSMLAPSQGPTTMADLLKLIQGGGNKTTSNAADLASILGNFSSGEKANRVVQGQDTQNYDKLMLDAQQARDVDEGNSLKRLAQTSYLANGGFKGKPQSITLNGKTVTLPFSDMNPPSASAAQIAGANDLQSQLIKRLQPGGTYTPQPLSSYATPGTAEKVGNYGALAAGGLGVLNNMIKGSSDDGSGNGGSSILSSIPWGSIGSGLKGVGGDIIGGLSKLFGG